MFLVALVLYFALTTSIFLILGTQSLPGLTRRYPALLDFTRAISAAAVSETEIESRDELAAELEARGLSAGVQLQQRESDGGPSVLVLHLLLVPLLTVAGGVGLALPYQIFLKKIRRGIDPPERLWGFCRKTLRLTPQFYAGLVLLPHLILVLLISGGSVVGVAFQEAAQGGLWRFMVVGLTAALLQALFISSWQRFRVQMLYLQHFYSREELEVSQQPLRFRRLSARLWVTNTVTTFLPISIIVTYLVWSIAPLRDPIGLSSGELAVLQWAGEPVGGLWYVNAVDTVLMFSGIASGALISVIYVILLIRWTTGSIVGPVQEVLAGMRSSAEGEFSHRATVRDGDEIGELATGFNRMNDQLGGYFRRISRLNQAYYRFVPEQFLRILGKESIEDVRLGDQIQQEMTLLYSDIRRFNALTEQMPPQESFAFINRYLGAMEPAITENAGFIDRFIGDAIMALFESRADGAFAAALEMQQRLRATDLGLTEPVRTGIGIHTGTLMLGLVGGSGRMDGTVISDAVNLTSRLEGLTKHFGCAVLVTRESIDHLSPGHSFLLRPLGRVAVSGRRDPVEISELLDPHLESDRIKAESRSEFAEALALYQHGEFEPAQERFYTLHAQHAGDLPSRFFAARAAFYLAQAPVQWRGVESFTQKQALGQRTDTRSEPARD